MKINSVIRLAVLLAVILTGCGSRKPHELTREDFDSGMYALQDGNLETVEEVVYRLAERDPAEPLIPFFRGMLAHHQGDTGAADLLFDDFYSAAYNRYVKGYEELSIYGRSLISTASTAALEITHTYIEDGRYMASNLFDILVDDLDAVARFGGAGR
ncbi:hypothetical protein KAU45_06660 [bacterium]|nr:hypothetical protein [bacterium]